MEIAVFSFLYFIPTFVAVNRRHRNRLAIGCANLFFGWTGIGWIVCLIWSLTAHVEGERRD